MSISFLWTFDSGIKRRMRRQFLDWVRWSSQTAGCFVFLLAWEPALAAQSGGVTLGSGTGTPGKPIHLPIYFNLPGSSQMERITAFVDYPPSLSYSGAEVAKEHQSSGVAIQAKDAGSGSSGKSKRLEVTLKAGRATPLRSGLVGTLSFTIGEKAAPQMISLPVTTVRGFARGKAEGVALRGDSGSIAIYDAGMEPAPLVACFFFTH